MSNVLRRNSLTDARYSDAIKDRVHLFRFGDDLADR